ncbi:MAG: GTP-binding protein [Ktedonobacterales bacterium]
MTKSNDDKNTSSRSRLRSRAREILTFSNLTKLPSNLVVARKFVNALDWKAAQSAVESELQHKVALLGLANSGKSTLFNQLRGTYASAVSTQEGTTKALVRGSFGPFALIDTPGHLPSLQEEAISEAAAIIYLLDATKGIRPQDINVINQLRSQSKPLVVALNKCDTLPGDTDEAAAKAAAQLHLSDIIPISGRTGENIGEELIPAIIETSPEAALALGRELPRYRRQAAQKLVRSAALVALVAGLEPIPLVDIPIILGNQVRMVMRIAALYNEPLSGKPTRELAATVAGGLIFRYIAEEAAKAVPFGGDLVAGAIAAAGTWSLGQVATEYFDGGKKLSQRQMKDMFTRFYHRYREEDVYKQLKVEAQEENQRLLPQG